MRGIEDILSSREALTVRPRNQPRPLAPAASPGQLPEPVVEPKMSMRLTHAMDQIANPHPDAGGGKSWPASVQAEAQAILAAMAPRFRRTKPHTFVDWAQQLRAAVRNPPSDRDFQGWCMALEFTCRDVPEVAFTEQTARAALAEFKFWPSVADVAGLVVPVANRLQRKLSALKRIAEGPTEPERLQPTGPAPVPAWVKETSTRHMGPSEAGDLDPAEAQRSADQQLAALGFKRGADGKPVRAGEVVA